MTPAIRSLGSALFTKSLRVLTNTFSRRTLNKSLYETRKGGKNRLQL